MNDLVKSFMEHRPVSPIGSTIKPEQLKAVQAEITRLQGEVDKANERVKELEQAVLEEIENRDSREKWLDKLSSEISRYFCVDIGEHSSANNPWLEAFEAIPEGTLNKFAIEKKIASIDELKGSCNIYKAFPTNNHIARECVTVEEIDAYHWALKEQLRKEQENV